MLRCDVTCHTVRLRGSPCHTHADALRSRGTGGATRRAARADPAGPGVPRAALRRELVAPPPAGRVGRMSRSRRSALSPGARDAARGHRRGPRRRRGADRARPRQVLPRPGARSGPGTPPARRTRSSRPDRPGAGRSSVLAGVLAGTGSRSCPFGGGTSVVGGVEPLRGGFAALIALDLSRLDRLVDARRRRSQTAALQPGAARPAGGGAAQRARLHARPLSAVLRAGHHRRLRGDPLGGPGVHRLRPQRRAGGGPAPWPRRRAR